MLQREYATVNILLTDYIQYTLDPVSTICSTTHVCNTLYTKPVRRYIIK